MKRPHRVIVAAVSVALALGAAYAAAQEPTARVILVLDASGSMWGEIDGRTKIVIARDVISDLLADWDTAVHLGLTAYGHRRKGDCDDIEVLIPPRALDAAAVLSSVEALQPTGKTPLSQAVIEAARALRHHEEKATVVLVSDGEETCDRDPCAVGRELEAAGVDFTVHVVGFDVRDEATQAQLRCLARETGGRFALARDASTLTEALGRAVEQAKAPPPPASAAVAGTAELRAPSSVAAGWEVEVAWSGPNAANDYLTLVEAGAAEGTYRQYEYTRKGSPTVLVAPSEPGVYELRYLTGDGNRTLASKALAVTESTATLRAAASLSAGSPVEISWTGPDSRRDYLTLVEAGTPEKTWKQYEYTKKGNPITLVAPSEPGAYELRYLSGLDNGTLARAAVAVTVSTAHLDAPDSVSAGAEIEIHWTGPDSRGDFVTMVEAGTPEKTWKQYEYTKKGNPVTLIAPAAPGSYELRYASGEGYRTLARIAITVTASSARLDAPDSVPAGAEIEIHWTGPDSRGDFLTLVEAGTPEGKWTHYEYAKKGSPTTLIAPAAPGSYELRYLSGGQGYGTLVRRSITVTAPTARLDAPDSVSADAEIEVHWTGPDSRGDFVTIVAAGTPEGKWAAYEYTKKGSPLRLTAPSEPGKYELRYLSGGQGYGTLASRPIAVTPPLSFSPPMPSWVTGPGPSKRWASSATRSRSINRTPAWEPAPGTSRCIARGTPPAPPDSGPAMSPGMPARPTASPSRGPAEAPPGRGLGPTVPSPGKPSRFRSRSMPRDRAGRLPAAPGQTCWPTSRSLSCGGSTTTTAPSATSASASTTSSWWTRLATRR